MSLWHGVLLRGTVCSAVAAVVLAAAFTVPCAYSASDPRLDRDLRQLLVIDAQIADPSRELAAKQITNVEYTQRLLELRKVQRQIFTRLDAAAAHGDAAEAGDRVDSTILSRFTYKIGIPNPTVEQRERLFRIFLGKCARADFDIDQVAIELARRCGDIGGRDIQSLVQRALQEASQRAFEIGKPDQVTITREDLLRQFAPQGRE
jgi:SpoVK/Ycf46/Vps4 family AAA+-type ATPase